MNKEEIHKPSFELGLEAGNKLAGFGDELKEEAVEFAEWVDSNYDTFRKSDQKTTYYPYNAEHFKRVYYTLSELYDKFKEEKNASNK